MKNWLLISFFTFFLGCQKTNTHQSGDGAAEPTPSSEVSFHYYIDLPDFLVMRAGDLQFPSTDSHNSASVASYYRDIGVSIELRAILPRKNLHHLDALTKLVEECLYLNLKPNFIKISGSRYLSEIKGEDCWEVIVAEEADLDWLYVQGYRIARSHDREGFWVKRPWPTSEAEAIFEAIKAGQYVDENVYMKLMEERQPARKWVEIILRRDGSISLLGEDGKITLSELTAHCKNSSNLKSKPGLLFNHDIMCKEKDIEAVMQVAAESGLNEIVIQKFREEKN